MLAFGTSLFLFSDYFSEKQYQQQTKLKRKNSHKFQNDAVSIKKKD